MNQREGEIAGITTRFIRSHDTF